MYSNGTIKTNRKGLPVEHAFKHSAALRPARGTMEQYCTQLGNETYYFTCWMDNKPVHMLSSYQTGKASIFRNSSTGGVYEKLQLKRPTIIGDYNAGMGGTDLNDQLLSYYRTTVRTKKWPTRIR